MSQFHPSHFAPGSRTCPLATPAHHAGVIKMEGFQKERNEEWFSDPVYSHFGGYKMCLNVVANGNRGGKGTAYVYLMRGLTEQVWSPDAIIPESVCERITERERAQAGIGIPRYALHQDLDCQSVKNKQFLKDDTLFFRLDVFEPKL